MININHIDNRVFPASSERNSAGELTLGGVAVSELLATYGSPLYVVDEEQFRQRAADTAAIFKAEFAAIGTTAKVYYASKAFMCIAAAKWADAAGMNIDVASGGELAVALAAGVAPAKIGLHGNNKSRAELIQAAQLELGSVVLDSYSEVARAAAAAREAGKKLRVMLRVNSGVHASTHDYLATSHEDQKFGVPASEAGSVIAAIRSHEELEFIGVHCHIGSQIFALSGFQESAKRLVEIIAELQETGPIGELNLGGGFGIPYTYDEIAEAPDVAALAKQLAAIVRDTCAELNVPLPTVAFEPGRYIAGPAGVTLYTVGATKTVSLKGSGEADPRDNGAAARRYISVDGGMSDNARPALYGSVYTVKLANRVSEAPAVLSRVVGKHCESGDIVLDRDLLPADIDEGDVLAFAATGAYCWSLSSNYNYLPRPAVVAVRDGAARVIVRGETIEELVAKSVE